VERVRVWPFASGGAPRGTLRGSPTLSATVERGATALPLANATHASNLLAYPEDLRNNAEAGSSRPWSQFVDADAGVALQSGVTLPDGSTGTVSRFQVTGAGGSAQRQVQQSVSVPDNTDVCASVFVRSDQVWGLGLIGASKTPGYPDVRYRVDNGTFISANASAGESILSHGIVPAGNSWFRVWWAWNSRTGAAPVVPIMQLRNTSGVDYSGPSGNGLLLWGAMLNHGLSPLDYTGHPTLLQGDFIAAGGQLFMVAADTVLVNGAGSVPVINRVRGTIASGGAVTWYRPTCEMVLPAMQAGPVRRPGVIESTALDLVEVW
jgi:hypothetical protein